ncbi:MAG: HAD family hydrolase [Rhodospirillales bacterium]|nr:HAD family hydrolase [Rhodospirillales bacterium]
MRPRPAGSTPKKRNRPILYQAIFFDFDGVLVESAEIKCQAFRTLYSEHGETVLERVLAYHLAHEGISRVEKINHCHAEFLGIELSEQELAELAGRYSALVMEAVIACDGVPGALSFLQAYAEKLPIFVVSGTPERELRDIIERRTMAHYFTSTHGSPRHKGPIVMDLLFEHGLMGPDCLFVGDAMTDYQAAAETGLQFIGRVGVGDENPFPQGTTIIEDLTKLSV